MHGHFAKAVKEPHEYLMFAVDPKDAQIWYILVRNVLGPNDEFKGGQYIFRMNAPDGFPYKPPQFYALTPSGFYGINGTCCISIGEYHANDYRAAQGMRGFAVELSNGLMNYKDMGYGINLLTTTIAEKKTYAKDSLAYNQKHLTRELNLILEAYAGYSAKWENIPPNQTLEYLLGTTIASDTTPVASSSSAPSSDTPADTL
jgi:ubiquitin-protein ligase